MCVLVAGRAGGEMVSVSAERGPGFARAQRTAVLAPAGHAATLDCRVLRLQDKSVRNQHLPNPHTL